MKKNITFLLVILITSTISAQTGFSIGAGLGQRLIGQDTGTDLPQGLITYHLNEKLALSAVGSTAEIDADDADFEYNFTKLALQVNYDFSPFDSTRLESIFGFSYLMFDEDLNLEDDNMFGLDFGFQSVFNADKKFNYGIRVVSTFSADSPAGILTPGIFVRYKLF